MRRPAKHPSEWMRSLSASEINGQPSMAGRGGGDYAILPGDDDNNNNNNNNRNHETTSPASIEGKDCRLNIFREILCVSGTTSQPRYYEARPEHFPPGVSVFHTGALYVAIHRAMTAFARRYNQVYLGLFMSMLVLYVVVFWGTPGLFVTTDNGERKFNVISYYVWHAAIIYVVSMTAAFFLTRPVVKQFHERMESVVLEAAPLFRKVGCDLQYHRSEPPTRLESEAWWLLRVVRGCDRQSFIRIVPYSGSLTAEEAFEADCLWDPRRPFAGELDASPSTTEAAAAEDTDASRRFRVAVCGAQAYPGQVGHGRDPNFLYDTWREKLGDKIDPITWGAVATETRTYTDSYHRARQWSVFFGLAMIQIPFWFMPDVFSSWAFAAPYIAVVVSLYFAMFYPSGLEVWWMNRVFGVPDLDGMRAAIQKLSPLVEERTGYRLRLGTEPEGRWGGQSTYVHFERRVHLAGAATSLSASMA